MKQATQFLIVDDDMRCGRLLEHTLSKGGFVAEWISNGEEAISCCEQDLPQLTGAIIDLNMPGLDGPATIAAMRVRRPDLQVIAISGHSLLPYFSRLSELGVRDFLEKPVCSIQLLKVLNQCSLRNGQAVVR
jgi:DNA-binding NtrC family response regulator